MEIQYFGGNCLRFTTNKKVRLIVDDNLKGLGAKSVQTEQDIALFTDTSLNTNIPARFIIDCPGEYEISEVSILGIPARRHIDEAGVKSTLYSVHTQDFSIAIIGHVDANLTDEQLERLGLVDVLCIPVGGHGYTLDGIAAAAIVKRIEPKIVIPTHYDDPMLTYEVPQSPLDDFLKAVGAGDVQPVTSFKLKESDLGDKPQVVVLERQ